MGQGPRNDGKKTVWSGDVSRVLGREEGLSVSLAEAGGPSCFS